jgi:phage-related protein
VIGISAPCPREIKELPASMRGDLADTLARLDAGLGLSMPLLRPIPGIRRGVHELRVKDGFGGYRAVYALIRSGTVYGLHAFKKTTQATPKRNVEIARRRLKEYGL